MSNLIILFSADPLPTPVNYDLLTIENAVRFGAETRLAQPGEPVNGGQLTNLTRFLTEKQPVLLIFDADNEMIPVEKWVAVLKSSPATRRLPVLVYGNSADSNTLLSAGADKVVTRAAMAAHSSELILSLAKQIDTSAIQNWCAQPLPVAAHDSIALFNSGKFYDAHHALEDLWKEDDGAARDFYRAILQVAVAYYQIERGNYRGAVKMFLRVRQWLEPLPDVCRGVDLAQLRGDCEAAFERVNQLGAERIGEFGQFRPIQLASPRKFQ